MNYLLRSKPKSGNNGKVVTVAIFFLFFFALSFFWSNFFRGIFTKMAKPIWVVGESLQKPFGSMKDYFSSRNALITENVSLKENIVALNLRVNDYDAVTRELEDLKNLSGRANSSHRIVTGVISRPPQSPYDTLIIDAGESEGVTANNRVYLSDTVLVGLVESISTNSSVVPLFSTGGKKTEATLSRTGASYTLLGRGGGNFNIEVPKDTDIIWGDSFMYPGLSTAILGSVYFIDTNSQSSFKTIYIRIPGNIFGAKYLFVE